ncbi:hypothetical protein [Bradyrhizobium sp. RDI18]|uniref:hypothetical protein n=1 Tax=Bradyrhizobium sp. RDI18 TaxID=3367400 RepID=UPI00370FFAEC
MTQAELSYALNLIEPIKRRSLTHEVSKPKAGTAAHCCDSVRARARAAAIADYERQHRTTDE